MILLFSVTSEHAPKRNDQIEKLIAKIANGDTASLYSVTFIPASAEYAPSTSETLDTNGVFWAE